MERESFEDIEVAKLLNERFVSIKVDREERPDIDSIYMNVCQMMTGHGGWPLSIFMTPNTVPFYAGTYFPKEARYGFPGFMELLIGLSGKYQEDPNHINEVAESVLEALGQQSGAGTKTKISKKVLEDCYDHYVETFDGQYGGFGEAPKFPMPHTLTFLLRYFKFSGEEHALDMVVKTLDGLANGGIYDHIGYGFSRYSVDEKFLVPHFEKMLYDNALLAIAYTEAYQVTKEERFQLVAEQILTYVLREMQHAEGGFYSAEDADSEGVEGKFYIWKPNEVLDVLGEELGSLFCQVYDITEKGNFEEKSIPNLIGKDIMEYANQNGLSYNNLLNNLEQARRKLFEYRDRRIHPYKDDKILTSWNGIMVAALAKAAKVFNNGMYLAAAEKTIHFIEEFLVEDGRVMVRYRDGDVKNKGFIDDYAFLLWAHLELYESSLTLEYLGRAVTLAKEMLELFWDKEDGGFFFSGYDNEELLVRQKEAYDGAIPSGNSVAAMQLLRLSRLTGDFEIEEKVQTLFDAFSEEVIRYPSGHSFLLQAFLLTQMGMKEVIVLGEESNEFLQELQKQFYPEVTYLVSNDFEKLTAVAPFTRDYQQIEGKDTIYICENYVCKKPTTNVREAIRMLKEA